MMMITMKIGDDADDGDDDDDDGYDVESSSNIANKQ